MLEGMLADARSAAIATGWICCSRDRADTTAYIQNRLSVASADAPFGPIQAIRDGEACTHLVFARELKAGEVDNPGSISDSGACV